MPTFDKQDISWVTEQTSLRTTTVHLTNPSAGSYIFNKSSI
jgi:hypothetical protein